MKYVALVCALTLSACTWARDYETRACISYCEAMGEHVEGFIHSDDSRTSKCLCSNEARGDSE